MGKAIFDPSVDELATLLEESARATKSATKYFIEPGKGTLRRARIKRHQIVFGRRGSGKSSLLYKTAEDLTASGAPVAYVDLEPFKGHQYPDVLISVLLATLRRFREWLEQEPSLSPRRRRWYTLFLVKTKSVTHNARRALLDQIDKDIAELLDQLHLPDHSHLTESTTSSQEQSAAGRAKSRVGSEFLPLRGDVESEIASATQQANTKEHREEFKRSKIDYLHHNILDFQTLFQTITDRTSRACFLILDDLYHIVRSDQPQVLDYFHRIAKGNNLWLKIGTIKNRSSWYSHSPQPIGLKLGDDADDINLDLTLEKFTVTRLFLRSVLNGYVKEATCPPIDDIVAEGGMDRLVIASGGVTRDFLGLFRRSIEETRERLTKSPNHPRGAKIGAEDVNVAAGAYGETKREEFQKDTLDDRDSLQEAFRKIRIFCLEKTKTNVFLVDQDLQTRDYELLQELIDLRLVHHVRSRVTVSSRAGRSYRALLLDVSQYTGERKKYDVDMFEFWKDANKERMRRALLIYNPNQSLQDIQREAEVTREKGKEAPADSGEQTTLDI